jgi:8-oxo-dGTP pyrophosphatase MutT (NUDIX family)
LREDQVTTPSGKAGIYGVVEAKLAVAVLAVESDRSVYLVGQYRYPTDMYSWEVIEGGGEVGEEPLLTAQRELREEAGLIAKNWQLLGGEVHLSNCFTNERGYIYLARDLESVGASPDENEVLELKRVSWQQFSELIRSGKIVDALSILAFYRYQELETF